MCVNMLVWTHEEETDGQKITTWETTDVTNPRGASTENGVMSSSLQNDYIRI